MATAIFGRKKHMTQAFQDDGTLVGVTVIEVEPNVITAVRTAESDGYEAVQVRIDFEKGTAFGKHTHPGEEVIYVLEGVFVYEVEGQLPLTLKAGDTLFVPAGTTHAARNTGKGKAVELATYIVEKGKPLLEMVDDDH